MNLTSFTELGAQQEAVVVDKICAVTITGVWRNGVACECPGRSGSRGNPRLAIKASLSRNSKHLSLSSGKEMPFPPSFMLFRPG